MNTATQEAVAKQAQFEGWAIVEMMGHQREIGYVTTEAFGVAVLFRIDVPSLQEREFTLTQPTWTQDGEDPRLDRWSPAGSKVKRAMSPARSRLIAPGAIYAVNPCSEEAARAALEKLVERPLILLEIPIGIKTLPAPTYRENDDEDESDDTPF